MGTGDESLDGPETLVALEDNKSLDMGGTFLSDFITVNQVGDDRDKFRKEVVIPRFGIVDGKTPPFGL